MRRLCITGILIILILFLTHSNTFAGNKPIQVGDPFPEIKLPIPEDPAYQKYLGVSGKGTFQIKDIKTDVVVLQIFHSG